MVMKRIGLFALLCTAIVLLGSPAFANPQKETAAVPKEISGLAAQFMYIEQQTVPLIQEFEKATGIKVNIDVMPEAQLLPKVRTVLGSKDDAYDVILYRGNLLPEMLKAGSLQPLDAYIAKDKAAVAVEDFVAPSLSVFIYDGKTYGFPTQSGGIMLFYNKDIFAQAGLTRPPKNAEELEEWSKIVKEKTGKAAFALPAMRDSGIIVYPWIFLWKLESPKWYDNIKGVWFNEKWEPQVGNKEAIAAADRWARILRNYGPAGVASYGQYECALDFEQGNLAMFMHQTYWAAEFNDPAKSKVVGRVGYAVLEGRPGDNKYGTDSPWGYVMNSYSKKKDLAWEFIKWAASKEFLLKQIKLGYNQPFRVLAIDSKEFSALLGPELTGAVKKAAMVADPAYKPIIPQQGEINEIMAVQLSKVLSGQATAEKAMQEANDKILAIMKRDGYIK